MTARTGNWIRIDAPDGVSAFLLERRLFHLLPTAVCRHGAWRVELECDPESEDEVLAAVRHWLRESSADSTEVVFEGGGRTLRVGSSLYD
jgi:hypothetical protein